MNYLPGLSLKAMPHYLEEVCVFSVDILKPSVFPEQQILQSFWNGDL